MHQTRDLCVLALSHAKIQEKSLQWMMSLTTSCLRVNLLFRDDVLADLVNLIRKFPLTNPRHFSFTTAKKFGAKHYLKGMDHVK